MNDLQLRKDVLDELEFEPSANAALIGVAVERGAVTLTGQVSTYPEKHVAVKAVRRVKGLAAERGNTNLVRDGWITLSGNVAAESAEEDVCKLPGVRGVTNNIVITPRVQAQDVKRKIEDALKRHDQTRAKGISVTVRDGDKVALEGKVRNWDEWSAVENAAWSVPGVKRVEDRLAIA